ALFEGTNVSEGRGTTMPFLVVGAPWIDENLLADKLALRKLAGVYFRPHRFKPFDGKYKGEICKGIQLHLLNRADFRAVNTGIAVLEEICSIYPEKFRFLQPFEGEHRYHFDLLWGSDVLRKRIQKEYLF
ncbi:DUF1343 domain-containing protein, partial [candidate division KSB1 bacterium]